MPFEPAAEQQQSQGRFVPSVNERVFREETGTIINAPSGLNANEIGYFDDTQNNSERPGSFFGMKKIGNPLGFAKGYMRGVISGGTSLATVGLEGDERRLRKIREFQDGTREFGFIDWLFESGQPIWEKKKSRPERWAEEEQKLIKRIGETKQAIKDMPRVMKGMGLESDSVSADLGQGFTSLVQTVSITRAIGLAVTLKNASVAALVFGAQQKSSDYVEARDAGLSIDDASEASYMTAGAVTAIEAVGTGALFKAFAGGNILKRAVNGFLVQGSEEGAQELATILIKNGYDITNTDFKDGLGQVLYASLIGGLLGAPVASIGGPEIADLSDQTGIPEGDLKRVMEIMQDTVSKNPEVAAAAREQLNEFIDEEFSPMKDGDSAQDEGVVGQMINDFLEFRDIDTSKLNDAEKRIVEQNISEVEDRLREIDAQEKRGFFPVPKRPETLSQFLKKAGGIRNDTAEANRYTRKETPSLRGVVNKNGKLSLDDARALAVEEGFLADTPFEGGVANTTEQDLLDLLEREANGEDIVRASDFSQLERRDQIIAFNEDLDQQQTKLLDDVKQVKTFRAAFKKGVRAAQKDVAASQEAIITALEKAPLRPEDRAKFIRQIKNVQTPDQLRKAAPKIESRVEKLLDANSRRIQKGLLTKILSKDSIGKKIQAGKSVGKFDAQTQARLDELASLSKLTQEQAQAMLSERLNAGSTDALGNRILSIKANPSDVSATDIAIAVAEIKALKQFGLAQAEARTNNFKAQADEVIDEISAFINRKGNVLTKKEDRPILTSFKQNARQAIARLAESWDDVIDRVADQATADKLDVTGEVQQQKKITRVMADKIVSAAQEAYSLKGAREALQVLDDSGVTQDLGIFVNMNGEEVRVQISRSQARKLWMEYQSERLRETTLQSETGNAYTDEMLRAMFDVMTQEDIVFAQKQLEIYEDFYDQINEVYSKVFGVNLPKEEFYSPIRREIDQGDANEDKFLREVDFRRAIATGSAIKLRDQNAISPLVLQSDVGVYNSHVAEMAHFIAFREKTMMLDRVFGNAKLRQQINKAYGKEFMKLIDDEKESIAGIGRGNSNILDRSINFLNRNFATSVLGLKAKIGMSQLSSYFAYAEFIPTSAFIDGTRDFFVNYKQAVQILGSSELMKARGASPDVDIARIGKVFDNKTLRKIQQKKDNIIDYTLIFTRMGDRAAIYAGGWGVYKHAIEQGKTHEQAILEFEKATSKTQQSSDVDKLSFLQKESPIVRSLTMFMSAPMAQFRGEVRAFRKFFSKGEISGQDFAKRLIIYHFLIPQFYQALANGLLFGEWDEEDQLRAAVLGSLNGIPIMGDIINRVFRGVQGKRNSESGLFKWAGDIEDFLKDAFDAFESGTEGDFAEFTEIMLGMGSDAAAIGLGAPTPQIEQSIEGVEKLQDGEVKPAVLRFLGFPDTVADGGDSGKKKSDGGSKNGLSGF